MSTENELLESDSNELYTLLPTVLDEMIEYIEEHVEIIDNEFGSCKGIDRIKKEKKMPNLYYKLTLLKNGG